jgi:hypothetical protein
LLSPVHSEAAELYKERVRRRAQTILWHRGILSGKLHAGQDKIEAAYNGSSGKLFVGDCSRQLGKTTWGAIKCIEKALQKRRAKIRVGTAFLTDLEQFVIPAFEFALEDCPDELRPKWNAQKYTYTFPSTKAEIRLVGLDRKPNGLRGNKLDLVLLEEAGFISNLKRLYQYVLIPATTHVPDARILMLSTQPDSPDHDFNAFCDQAMEERCYIQLDIYQNPLLSPDDIARLAAEMGGTESIAFQREYLCRRVVDVERAIVPEFSKALVFERAATEFDQFYHRYLWMDIGVQKDLTFVGFAMYCFREAYAYVEDEVVIRGPEVTTRKIRDAIRAKLESTTEPHLAPYKNCYRRVADNSHPLLLNDLAADQEYPLYFQATDKEKLHEMVNELRIFTGALRLRVHPRCVHFIGSMSSGIWDKNRKEFARSPVYGHADAVAAGVYGVRNLDLNSNPIPPTYGIDLANSFMALQRPVLSKSAKTLQEAFRKKR